MIKSRQGHNEAASGDAAIAPRLRLENPWRRDAELVSKNRKSLASKATRWLVWTAVFLICVTAKTVANPLFFFGAILYTFLLLAAGVCCIDLLGPPQDDSEQDERDSHDDAYYEYDDEQVA